MHVQRPGADRVAAGQRHHGAPAARDQRAQHAHRGPQLRHRPVVGLRPRARPGTSIATVSRSTVDRAAEAAQHVGHQRDVEDLRAVGERRRALGQQRRRHQLEHAVLGADHVDRARPAGRRRSPRNALPRPRRYLLRSPVAPSGLPSAHGRAPDQDLHQDRRRRDHGARRLQPGPQDRRPARRLRRHRRGQRGDRRGRHRRRAGRGGARAAAAGPERPVRRGRRPVHADRRRTRSTRRCGSPRTT